MIIGVLSALGCSCCWATCSIFFTAAAQRLGVLSLNLVRLVIAVGFLGATLFLWKGTPIPAEATGEDWLWLAVSAVIGLVLGDLLLFAAFKSVGPRVTMLFFTLAPPVAAIGEWIVFAHPLGLLSLAGMAVALTGVAMVITERKSNSANSAFSITAKGIALAAGGAICQGAGLVFSKMGLGNIDPMSGTFLRMIVAAPTFALVYFAVGGSIMQCLRHGKGLAFALGGAFFGPFLGVTLSLVAVKHAHAGIAMTVMSTTPITILPFAILVYGERLSMRAVLGAVVAVAGVALLCLPT
jgi:drug/metabolite transporter (DMT)-like permease